MLHLQPILKGGNVCLAKQLWLPCRRCLVSCRGLSVSSSAVKKVGKRRLDEVALEQFPQHSRSAIQSWIAQGKVSIEGRVHFKAGTPVDSAAAITLTANAPKFVCRAGLKLEAALDHFQLPVTGLRCLDAGLSTGGFADCLLQRGAASVIGVDVGYGQVAERVRTDDRVTIMERTNLRYVRRQDLPEGLAVQLVTLDLSFISVLKVMPAVCDFLEEDGGLIVLIKPQFEAGRSQVSSGGVVRDPVVHQEVIRSTVDGVEAFGFVCQGHIESPLKGNTSGNIEFLAYFKRGTGGRAVTAEDDSFVNE